mmetsp:Transcript_22831/g.58065  ORF Transcript_22831/g.58065 Transcript_22831/m.58065 type:complete len:116 (+) Transcript_22831:2-349(+)
MLKYNKAKREYDEWKAGEDMVQEARAIAGGEAGDKKGTTSASQKLDSQMAQNQLRKPPPKPHFSIAGTPEHFAQLAIRCKKKLEQDAKAKDRAWAEQDRALHRGEDLSPAAAKPT